MSEFEVRTSSSAYRVSVGGGSFRKALADGGHQVILADQFFQSMIADAASPAVFVVAEEQRKNLAEVDRILGEFSEHGLTRGGSVLAVGGGIVQDLGTFAASVYMRGVRWTYVPTTLMAMADSCIGGKSSLNVSGTKNLAGNIYPPSSVVVDPEFVATLQPEDVAAGLGEAVKISFCAGREPFESYLRHFEAQTGWEPLLESVLSAKKWFVEIDEFDRRERRLLNFGHTFAHALESATGFSISHGVAVAVGVLAAVSLRRKLFGEDGCDQSLSEHCVAILSSVPRLAERLERVDVARFLTAFLKDKKHPPNGLRVVLPKAGVIGVEEVSLPRSPDVLDAVEAALGAAIEAAGPSGGARR